MFPDPASSVLRHFNWHVSLLAGDVLAHFDQWYADLGQTPVTDEIHQRHMGLPAHLLSTSMLTWAGIAEVTDALRLAPGEVLLDLACGRGGYGLEVAGRTGARLVGVDFSAVAVSQARQLADRLGRAAQFRVGDLARTGLDDDSVDAAMFVDVDVVERADWRLQERAMWDEAAALDPGHDPAPQSFHDEAVRSIQHHDRRRRVFGTATA